jgi:Rrf2 family protein
MHWHWPLSDSTAFRNDVRSWRSQRLLLEIPSSVIEYTGGNMISQRAKYALKALLALARVETSAMIGDIAKQHRIPHKFLEQILLDLKREGLVQSRRGRSGGYALLRPADQITFGEVLRIVDGPIAPLPCLSRTAYRRCADCHSERSCEVRRVFSDVAESARLVLDQMTIADAVAGHVANGTRRPHAISGKSTRQVAAIARK